MGKNLVRKIVFVIVALIICRVLWYLGIPAVNVHSAGFWGMIFVNLAIILIALAISLAKDDQFYDIEPIAIGISISVVAIPLLVLLVGWITSWKMFSTEEYRNIANVEEGSFAEDFPEVLPDGSNIPYVDLETARKLGDRTIGKLNHSSWYEVDDEYNLICYDGEYYRLSPLNYSGIFTYHKGKYEGIPGYVLVNVETQAAEFVPVEGGFYYSPSAFWGKDLGRHLRKQFSGLIFGNSYFEIDDEKNPYWVTAVNDVSIGLFGGWKEERFVITNAITGESEMYAKGSLPDWVDHAVSLDYSMTIAERHYRYVHGYWNFSKTDVYKTSYSYKTTESEDRKGFAGYNSFVDSNGEICFYTGLTPANNAESNTGFLLINCRTGDIREYAFEDANGGIEESTGIERAESEVQNFGYTASFPLMLNIADQPTYLMCLKGNDGLIKQIALAMVSTSSTVIVTDENLDGAIAKYEDELVKAQIIDGEESLNLETGAGSGKISAKYEITVDGTTHYLYQINGNKSVIYDASIKCNYAQATYEVGDTVIMIYQVSDDNIKTVYEITK